MKGTSTQLSRLLCTFDLTTNKIVFVNHTDCIGKPEEDDITLIDYMLQAAGTGAPTIRILSDDTDIFVLLVHWAWKANVQSTVQMEKWNGTILDINATIREFGQREPPAEARDFSKFGWEVAKAWAVMPALAIQAVAPTATESSPFASPISGIGDSSPEEAGSMGTSIKGGQRPRRGQHGGDEEIEANGDPIGLN
ncbi:unnamed protein product [Boreogadus saida]